MDVLRFRRDSLDKLQQRRLVMTSPFLQYGAKALTRSNTKTKKLIEQTPTIVSNMSSGKPVSSVKNEPQSSTALPSSGGGFFGLFSLSSRNSNLNHPNSNKELSVALSNQRSQTRTGDNDNMPLTPPSSAHKRDTTRHLHSTHSGHSTRSAHSAYSTRSSSRSSRSSTNTRSSPSTQKSWSYSRDSHRSHKEHGHKEHGHKEHGHKEHGHQRPKRPVSNSSSSKSLQSPAKAHQKPAKKTGDEVYNVGLSPAHSAFESNVAMAADGSLSSNAGASRGSQGLKPNGTSSEKTSRTSSKDSKDSKASRKETETKRTCVNKPLPCPPEQYKAGFTVTVEPLKAEQPLKTEPHSTELPSTEAIVESTHSPAVRQSSKTSDMSLASGSISASASSGSGSTRSSLEDTTIEDFTRVEIPVTLSGHASESQDDFTKHVYAILNARSNISVNLEVSANEDTEVHTQSEKVQAQAPPQDSGPDTGSEVSADLGQELYKSLYRPAAEPPVTPLKQSHIEIPQSVINTDNNLETIILKDFENDIRYLLASPTVSQSDLQLGFSPSLTAKSATTKNNSTTNADVDDLDASPVKARNRNAKTNTRTQDLMEPIAFQVPKPKTHASTEKQNNSSQNFDASSASNASTQSTLSTGSPTSHSSNASNTSPTTSTSSTTIPSKKHIRSSPSRNSLIEQVKLSAEPHLSRARSRLSFRGNPLQIKRSSNSHTSPVFNGSASPTTNTNTLTSTGSNRNSYRNSNGYVMASVERLSKDFDIDQFYGGSSSEDLPSQHIPEVSIAPEQQELRSQNPPQLQMQMHMQPTSPDFTMSSSSCSPAVSSTTTCSPTSSPISSSKSYSSNTTLLPHDIPLWLLNRIISSKGSKGIFVTSHIFISPQLWKVELPSRLVNKRCSLLSRLSYLGSSYLNGYSNGYSSTNNTAEKDPVAAISSFLKPLNDEFTAVFMSSLIPHESNAFYNDRDTEDSLFGRFKRRPVGGGSPLRSVAEETSSETATTPAADFDGSKKPFSFLLKSLKDVADTLECLQRTDSKVCAEFRSFVGKTVCRLVIKDILDVQEALSTEFRQYMWTD